MDVSALLHGLNVINICLLGHKSLKVKLNVDRRRQNMRSTAIISCFKVKGSPGSALQQSLPDRSMHRASRSLLCVMTIEVYSAQFMLISPACACHITGAHHVVQYITSQHS